MHSTAIKIQNPLFKIQNPLLLLLLTKIHYDGEFAGSENDESENTVTENDRPGLENGRPNHLHASTLQRMYFSALRFNPSFFRYCIFRHPLALSIQEV